MDLLNALIVFSNFVFIPALAYGSQLALGALGVRSTAGDPLAVHHGGAVAVVPAVDVALAA